VKPSNFVSYIKSPPLSDAASYKAPEKISCTQDTLLLRIIRWYILSTIWMLQKNSLPTVGRLYKIEDDLQHLWPSISQWAQKSYEDNSPHLVNPSLTLSRMLWRTFVGTFPLSTSKKIIAKLYTPDDFVSFSLFSSNDKEKYAFWSSTIFRRTLLTFKSECITQLSCR